MSQKRKKAGLADNTGAKQSSPHVGAAELVPGWALGQTATDHAMSDRERKLTAAMYAQSPGVVAHVQREGRLPKMQLTGGMEIGLRLLVRERGIDLDLSGDEQVVLDAIARSGQVPVGCAVLLDLRALRGR